jgi:hypothetical protein
MVNVLSETIAERRNSNICYYSWNQLFRLARNFPSFCALLYSNPCDQVILYIGLDKNILLVKLSGF